MFSSIDIFEGLLISLGAVYALLICLFINGWLQIKTNSVTAVTGTTKVSILIPFRNEYRHIEILFNDLQNQSYPPSLLEIVFINDHSEDGGEKMLENLIQKNNKFRLIHLTESFGKKAALYKGVQLAKGQLILTTDADCHIGGNWVTTIVENYEANKPKLLCGPVVYHHESNMFQKMQSLEYNSLMASGAGSIGLGLPLMCSGANMAFEKRLFEQLDPYNEQNKYASGDDQFLLFAVNRRFGSESIQYIKDKKVLVFTEAQKTVQDFLKQRIRWGSKSKAYDNIFAKLTAIIVFCFCLLISGLVFIGLYDISYLWLAIIAIIYKSIFDFLLLCSYTFFYKKTSLLWWFLPLQLIYPFYISITGLLSLFNKNEWKGRRIK